MHPGLELVGEMKRLRRAPEPTSAMEPWLQKAVDAKLSLSLAATLFAPSEFRADRRETRGRALLLQACFR